MSKKNGEFCGIKIEKDLRVILFILLISIFGLLVNGYRYDYMDQALYIPMIERALNPELFENDYFFDEPSEEYNLWLPLMTTLARFFPLEWVFFVGYVLTRFALFWAIYHVSLNLFGRREAAAIAVLMLVILKPVGGTATTTQDIFFTLRSTIMPLAIAFLIPYFRGRLVFTAIICGIIFLMHPITALPLIFLLVLRLLIECFRHNWRASAKAFGVFLLCCAPLLIRVFLIEHTDSSNLSFFSRSDPEWIEIIKQRHKYIFFSIWHRDGFISLAAYFGLLPAILLFRRWYVPYVNDLDKSAVYHERNESHIRNMDFWAYGVIIVCAFLFIIGGVFVDWYPLPLVVQMQIVRSSYLMVNLTMIYAAWLLWEGVRRWRKALATTPHDTGKIVMIRRYIYSFIGTIIPIYIAALFLPRFTNWLVLGSVSIICWWICFNPNRLHILWRLAGGLVWCAIILLFRGYFIPALSRQIFFVVLVSFVFLELIRLLSSWRNWERMKWLATGCLLITTLSALVTLNIGRLEQVLIRAKLSRYVNLPGRLPYSDWSDVQQWCRGNTAIDAVFFVPTDIQGFRVYSRRAIAGDWKDGAPGVFSESYAKKWWGRMEELRGYDSFDETRFNQLKGKYGASFAVTRRAQQLKFPVVYQNNEFVVYSLHNDFRK